MKLSDEVLMWEKIKCAWHVDGQALQQLSNKLFLTKYIAKDVYMVLN